jgi:hypothetical protein
MMASSAPSVPSHVTWLRWVSVYWCAWLAEMLTRFQSSYSSTITLRVAAAQE